MGFWKFVSLSSVPIVTLNVLRNNLGFSDESGSSRANWAQLPHSSCHSSSPTLKQVQVFFRHGRRTPMLKEYLVDGVVWPSEWVDKDLPETLFNHRVLNIEDSADTRRPFPLLDYITSKLDNLEGGAAPGKLTTFGQKDAFELGKKLRKRYIEDTKLVGLSLKNSETRIYSTNLQRTIKSARCVLAGMFDESSSDIALIHTRPNEYDYYYPNYYFCLPYENLHRQSIQLENSVEEIANMKAVITKTFNLPQKSAPDAVDIWEEMYLLKKHGFQIPETYEAMYGDIERMASKLFSFRAFDMTPQSLRFSSGLLINEVACNMRKMKYDQDAHVVYLNSVHDSTIAGLLKTIKCYDDHWPDVSSYLALELHKIGDNWLVRAVYNDKVLDLDGSTNGFTPLAKFYDSIAPVRIKDMSFERICGRTHVQIE